MAKMLKLKLGVADDPAALQPSLNDCLSTMLQQAETLMGEVVQGLVKGMAPLGPHSVPEFQRPNVKTAILALDMDRQAARDTYKAELTRLVYEGGGKETVQTEVLRYEDLQLFGDDELDQSIEVARALQEVLLAVDDVLPTLDALVCTLMGWRTIQPGLNPIRPDVFVRSLQTTLARHVPDAAAREILVTPAGGLLGANLRRLYRELADWLQSTGVEPAVPPGGKSKGGANASAPAMGTMAKTMLTLDRLRKLLAGDFDQPKGKHEFLHTVPASMAMLQELKQVDALVKRLEQRPKPTPAPQPVDMLAAATHEPPAAARLGRQLSDEVLRLMFDTLLQDTRLLPAFKEQLRTVEPAVRKLADQDSRFFSDRTHPARQFLDRITQRSLAFQSENDEGWQRFLDTVQYGARWLADSKVVDADVFGELLDHMQSVWAGHDSTLRQRREDAARALLQAEQRNLLAQKLAQDFEQACKGDEVAPFVLEFLRGCWAQVVAQAQLTCADGSDDPFGYRALVDDLVWSVQVGPGERQRARRLAQMVPTLLARLREGLARIDYPAELSQRFFDSLMALHATALQGVSDEATQALAEAVPAQPVDVEPWLAEGEAQDSGWLDGDSVAGEEMLAEIGDLTSPEPRPATELRTGTWAELLVGGEWTRVQLTWASPHGTLFMFTALAGTAHSMSRRTLDRLRAQGKLRIVAERNVVDDALDQVAKAALKNSLNKG
ncbi:DUF1631 family protein [Ramlibacter sp. MMS24-I3-19]|uniref:DUF1631 family protein n=1 Tax=Ramlibacter sp. MMS24-I3-19 TaxID=3416606 RepID=UPI003CFCFBBD